MSVSATLCKALDKRASYPTVTLLVSNLLVSRLLMGKLLMSKLLTSNLLVGKLLASKLLAGNSPRRVEPSTIRQYNSCITPDY